MAKATLAAERMFDEWVAKLRHSTEDVDGTSQVEDRAWKQGKILLVLVN